MTIGQNISDFVGYSAGVPSSAPAEVGYVGLLDFVGLPVGILLPPEVGQSGLLDFTGYSVGVSEVVPVSIGYVGLLDFIGYSTGVSFVIPPTPIPEITIEARRWPGPPFILYQEGNIIPTWQRKREDEEIILI